MKLSEVVAVIDSLDEDLIIFQERRKSYNAMTVCSTDKGNGGGVIINDGKEYHYLIEVLLAKEFIIDWVKSLTYKPGNAEIAERLYDFAMNDA
ncbi:MAG: hypothetical protein EOP45_17905 [Sphingobacteriaceae bacterium]|nr:MAG: hypothetical protein EOP45_17905 [Sphingobacteriaceae bacterium]